MEGGRKKAKVAGGAVKVPPCDASAWKLVAGANADAAAADVIILGTIFEETWPVLEKLAPLIKGQGKIIIDMTNPWLIRGDGYGKGIAPPAARATSAARAASGQGVINVRLGHGDIGAANGAQRVRTHLRRTRWRRRWANRVRTHRRQRWGRRLRPCASV